AISTNRNGSRTLGIVSSLSRDLRTAVLFQADPVSGPYGTVSTGIRDRTRAQTPSCHRYADNIFSRSGRQCRILLLSARWAASSQLRNTFRSGILAPQPNYSRNLVSDVPMIKTSRV